MTQEQTDSLVRRFFASRMFLIVALFAALVVAFGYARAYYQDYQIRQEIRALEDEISSLEKKKLESLEILQFVTSDAFVEETARTELNMKRPGENVVVVQRNTSTEMVSQGADDDGDTHLSNPVQWWYYFTHTPLPEEGNT